MRHAGTKAKSTPALAALLALMCLGGCETQYHLRGVVLDAPDGPPTVTVVGGGDERLKEDGIRYATIELTVDPNGQNPDYMAPARTDGHGYFDIPITEPGAGFLIYDLEIVARAEGHQPAIESIKLPSSFKRLVIMLPSGKDNYKAQRDLLNDTLRIQKELDP